ncbi:MAG TPA: hypothetical protein VFY39_10645 [Gammaproteobacteria bacterium]|nr:hypothetical protein [Gammaproteobacteria bacterium]
MLASAVVVFAIAAVGGLILALHVLRDKFAPWLLSILHALLGAAGLILLILTVLRQTSSLSLASLILFFVAALGGFFLASLHLRKRLPPKGVVVLHAVLAVAGFALLLTAFVSA